MSTVEAKPDQQENGGGAVTERAQIAVENPATGETIASVPDLDAAQVKALVDRARAAQPAWAELGFEGRAEVFYDLRKGVVDNRERVAQTIVEENGKPAHEAMLTGKLYLCYPPGFRAQ